jgi:hypothetical protein
MAQKLSQKSSLDSGFSDSSDSHQHQHQQLQQQQPPEDTNGLQVGFGSRGRLKSAVVHESHALTGSSSRMHHVSKVYFYSVSDVLRDAASSSSSSDCGASHAAAERKRTSDAEEEGEERSSSCPSTPRISAAAVCQLDYLDVNDVSAEGLLFESLPHPTRSQSPRGASVHTGTSSLRRKQQQRQKQSGSTETMGADPQRSGRSSPLMRSTTPSSSATQFPITNGSLYSDLSLNRRVAESQRARRRVEREASLRAFSAAGSASSGGIEREASLRAFSAADSASGGGIEREASLRAFSAADSASSGRLEKDSFNLTLSSLTTAHSDLDSMDNPLDASQHSVSSTGSTSSSCHTHMGFSAPSPPRPPRSHHPGAFFKRYEYTVFFK